MSDYSPNIDPKPTSNQTKPKETSTVETAESIRHFLRRIFDLRSGVDKKQTKEEIKSNISFTGMQVYVLIASIIIASIGLNASSTAVVIGAMLISPLMGPIVGFGYSIAVNDYITLRRSLMNFAVMVVIALLTSFIFFSLIPGGKLITTELRGRIEPTFLDVMIALAGGFAGIVGASSKNKNINVVAGVAIATALMPPLCTAGYGLAVGFQNIGYKQYTGFGAALNAFYLFFINSTFISISTFFFIKLLRFPMAKYMDAARRRKTNLFIGIAAILVMIPSGFIFYNIFKEASYDRKIKSFLTKEIAVGYPDAFLDLDRAKGIEDSVGRKTVFLTSLKDIPESTVEGWNLELKSNYGLENTRLVVRQSGVSADRLEEMSEQSMQSLFGSTMDNLARKDSIISSLENQIGRLQSDSIPFVTISRELQEQYNGLEYFGYGTYNYTNFRQKEVIPSFVIQWKADSITKLTPQQKLENEARIKNYLKARLKLDTIQFLR